MNFKLLVIVDLKELGISKHNETDERTWVSYEKLIILQENEKVGAFNALI